MEKFAKTRKSELPVDELREYKRDRELGREDGNWRSCRTPGSAREQQSFGSASTDGAMPAPARSAPHYEECFVNTARAEAREANIVIVNHHLFFADLVVRMKNSEASILPSAGAVVFDEAHELESVASESLRSECEQPANRRTYRGCVSHSGGLS